MATLFFIFSMVVGGNRNFVDWDLDPVIKTEVCSKLPNYNLKEQSFLCCQILHENRPIFIVHHSAEIFTLNTTNETLFLVIETLNVSKNMLLNIYIAIA